MNRGRTASRPMAAMTLAAAAAASVAMALGACGALEPTPYQPLQPGMGGYEEIRLQDDVYRVSFRGNRYTPETDIIDLLYLRCAELTLQADYTHFAVEKNFDRERFGVYPRFHAAAIVRPMVYPGIRARYWSRYRMPLYYEPRVYVAELDYRLTVFLIRMYRNGESGQGGAAEGLMEARSLVERLAAKKRASLPPAD